MVTRDRNRIALESGRAGRGRPGHQGIFCLSGEHQSLGRVPPGGRRVSTSTRSSLPGAEDVDWRRRGFRRQQARAAICSGAALRIRTCGRWSLNLLRLKKKIAAGAEFLLTQAIFDLAGFQRVDGGGARGGPRQAGGDHRQRAAADSVEQARDPAAALGVSGRIGEDVIGRLAKAADAAKEGHRHRRGDRRASSRASPGVRGIHILSDGCEPLVAQVIQEAGLA